jgi:hypothetical protein
MTVEKDARDRAALIGRICMTWSALEMTVAHLIWTLLELDDETGKIVTGGLNMLPSINIAINVARKRKAGQTLLKALLSTRKAIQDGLDARRNLAVHGVNTLHGDGKWLVEMHRKGRPPSEFPVADLEALADELLAEFDTLNAAASEWAKTWKGPHQVRGDKLVREGIRAGWKALHETIFSNILSAAPETDSTSGS